MMLAAVLLLAVAAAPVLPGVLAVALFAWVLVAAPTGVAVAVIVATAGAVMVMLARRAAT